MFLAETTSYHYPGIIVNVTFFIRDKFGLFLNLIYWFFQIFSPDTLCVCEQRCIFLANFSFTLPSVYWIGVSEQWWPEMVRAVIFLLTLYLKQKAFHNSSLCIISASFKTDIFRKLLSIPPWPRVFVFGDSLVAQLVESTGSAEDLGLIPESGKIHWRRDRLHTPAFLEAPWWLICFAVSKECEI